MIYIKTNSKSDTVVGVEDNDLKYVNGDNAKIVAVKENTVYKNNASSEGLKVIRDGFVMDQFEPLNDHITRRFESSNRALSDLYTRVWDAVKQFNRANHNIDSYVYLSDVDLYYLDSEGTGGGPLDAHFRKYRITNEGTLSNGNVALPNVFNDNRICHGSTSSSNYNNTNYEGAFHNIINGFFTTRFNNDLNSKTVYIESYNQLEDYFITRRSEQLGLGEEDIKGVLRNIKSTFEIPLENSPSSIRVNIVGLVGIACLLGIDYSMFKVR